MIFHNWKTFLPDVEENSSTSGNSSFLFWGRLWLAQMILDGHAIKKAC